MTDEADEIAAIFSPSAIQLELEAMQSIGDKFDKLDSRAQRRALDWARSRYKSSEPGIDAVMAFMSAVLGAIGAHQVATKQPRQIDRDLWDATIKGTRYWTEPEADQ